MAKTSFRSSQQYEVDINKVSTLADDKQATDPSASLLISLAAAYLAAKKLSELGETTTLGGVNLVLEIQKLFRQAQIIRRNIKSYPLDTSKVTKFGKRSDESKT